MRSNERYLLVGVSASFADRRRKRRHCISLDFIRAIPLKITPLMKGNAAAVIKAATAVQGGVLLFDLAEVPTL